VGDAATFGIRDPAGKVGAAEWTATSHGLAQGILAYSDALAREYLRGIRASAPGDDGAATVDLEAPFALEPSAATVAEVSSLMAALEGGAGKASLGDGGVAAAMGGALRLLSVNLRRLHTANVSPAAVGLATAAPAAAGGAGGKGGKKEGRETVTLDPAVSALYAKMTSKAEWGGGAAGRKLGESPSGAAGGLPSPLWSSPSVQEAVWQFLDLSRPFFTAAKDDRLGLIKTLAKGAGTVELQVTWPCEEYDGDGALVQLESLLLQLQLAARAADWRVRLLGRWPAKAYLVLDIPEEPGVAGFLEGDFADAVASLDLGEYWAGGAGDGLAVKVERAADWNRRARLVTETATGVVRVYPSYVTTFDAVVAELDKFLPDEK